MPHGVLDLVEDAVASLGVRIIPSDRLPTARKSAGAVYDGTQ